MINQTLIVSVIALAIGSAGGFFIGKSNSSALDSKNVKSSESSARGGAFSQVESKRRDAAREPVFRSSSEVFQQGSQVSRIKDLLRFYSKLDTYELEAEVDKLSELGMPDRMLASYLLFAQWAELDPVGAIAKTASLGRMGIFSKSTVLRTWASNDPRSAAAYYAENKQDFAMMGGGRRGGMSPSGSIAGEWTKEDPEGALSWALEQSGRDGTQAVSSVFTELAKSDPKKAAQMALNLDEDSRGAAYSAIARSLGASDYSAAEAWIAGLPVAEQNDVRATALSSLARNDPDAAASKLDTVTDPDQTLELIDEIASGYARGNGAEGVAFLLEIGNQDALKESINGPMRSWVLTEPEVARDYVLSMPSGQTRDTTLKSYLISDRANNDYEGQLDLSATIENEVERGDTHDILMTRFVRSDEDSARAYLAKDTALTEEQQEEIISNAQRSGRRGGFRGR